ncbi:prepilin-type N-terminal cleavage/methylation domain-containing protein [Paraglaciecola aquimarina]|uniref:Prepilin-type N-terminal cleavage/methylation domain-containing protein n=1 Tax=Paraglaciecola algarum TaxID=3050085 RepID=A0ABS9D630_9ALTE|nr:type IV pilin protein [Paraglaciecola sp. G1-23]MCF2948336.1 prepilin-type N-terminal cleavage/methylation domain-containing protein [Paraglaciecola sp. G1-23]
MDKVNSKVNLRGFSLVELMVVVAIVGVLTMVAYPSYQGFMVSSNRAAAQADLMSLGAAMERHKAAAFTYEGAAQSAANTGTPAIFHGHSPSAEPYANRSYNLLITVATGTSYVVEARPLSSSVQAGDGSVYLYGDGRRAWDANNSGSIGNDEFCWKC